MTQEVQESFDLLVNAANALDAEKYFSFIDSDKFVGLGADGSNWNSVEELRAMIVPGFNMVKEIKLLEFTNVKISVIDKNTAVLVNEYQQSMILANGELAEGAGGGTQVWSKASGNWLLVSISASAKR
ncbi:nuclear transport factor 2 family protein [Thalassomonas actiniarum]|uniref:nuclear transport factor 2 family protein n=1 Tax=Thalassomonas actiniarum TaxID=485447 RepID=UPI0022A8EEF9|nr:nuclear transport factor 2 family protein [Thalassomonas actiniarum]